MSGINRADLFGPIILYPTVSENSSRCGTSNGTTDKLLVIFNEILFFSGIKSIFSRLES